MSSDWSLMSLGEFAEINPPRVLKKGQKAPFVSMADLGFGRDIDITALEERVYNGGGTRFKNGDTLLARITPSLENGKTALVSGFASGQVCHGSTEFIVLAPRSSSDTLFLYYLARSPAFREYAIQSMEGSTGRQRVPTRAVAEYRFLCPPPRERERIGEVLGSLDDRIALLVRTNDTLEKIAQTMFRSWFIEFEPVRAKAAGRQPDGMDAETAALFPSEFEDSELGPIPKGWQVRSLDSFAQYTNGLALQKFPPKSDTDFLPIIKIAQMRAGHTAGAETATSDLDPQYVVEDGDVLFSWSGSLEVVIWTGGRGALNQHIFKVTSVEVPKWFYYFATKHFLPRFRNIAASKATTMGHIQRRDLREAKIAVPPVHLLTRMGEILNLMLERLILNGIMRRTLTEIRDTLLPRLISGKLRLAEAEEIVQEAVS